MARRTKNATNPKTTGPVADYRHAEQRTNIPSAGLAPHGKLQEAPKTPGSQPPA